MAKKPQSEIPYLLRKFAQAKREAEQAETIMRDVQAQLVEIMESEGVKSKTVASGSDDVTGTVVRGSRVVIDEARLKKELGAPLWKQCVKEVLDKGKLEANVATGKVDKNIVAQCSEVLDNKPFVKLSIKSDVRQLEAEDIKAPTKPRKKSAAAKKMGF